LLDVHPVAFKERDCAPEECDCGGRLLVAENLGVGQAGAVIDRDVHELPADRVASFACRVGALRVVVVAQTVTNALTGAALDAPELLYVDVD
jgi:hypothetical protein